VWACGADGIRPIDHLDLLIGMLGEVSMYAGEIVDEAGTIPLPSKALETQQGVPSQTEGARLSLMRMVGDHRAFSQRGVTSRS
jgi:hypothetical protein